MQSRRKQSSPVVSPGPRRLQTIKTGIRAWLALFSLWFSIAALGQESSSSGAIGLSSVTPLARRTLFDDEQDGHRQASAPVIAAVRAAVMPTPSDEALDYSDMQDTPEIVRFFRIVAGVLLLAFLLNCLRRQIFERSSPSETSEVDELTIEASNSPAPRSPEGLAALEHERKPASVLRLPVEESADVGVFARQIEIAARSCTRLSRTVGLICFEVPGYANMRRVVGAAAADATIGTVAEECGRILHGAIKLEGRDPSCPWIRPFRPECLHECDGRACRGYSLGVVSQVKILNRNQIVICVCMLTGYDALKHIAWKLERTLKNASPGWDGPPVSSMGYAIYPLDGYDGINLISAARAGVRKAGR